MTQLCIGNLKLTRFIVRRERMQILLWLVCLLFIILVVPPAFESMYGGDAAGRTAMAETMRNPAMIAMVGPVYGAGNYTMGAMFANEMFLFSILAVAVMNIFLVIRQTRRDEERGRVEVIRSLPVGRLSGLSATMTVALCVNALLALLSGLGLAALGIETMDLAGSLLFGAGLGVSGLFFAAVAALFSQLCAGSKGAIGYSFLFLGLFYIIRAIGDINNETLACLSPLGLILRAQVYVENQWWPVLIILLLTAVITAVAFYLNAIRDMDQGFIPARPGRKKASRLLLSPTGLAFRLLRTQIISWIVALFVLGAAYGSIMGDLESFLAQNEMFKQALFVVESDYSLTELFITMLMSVIAISSAIPCLSTMLKLRGEEKRGHTEHLLARAVSKTELMAGYFCLSMIGSFVMLLASTTGLWAASSAVMDTPIAFLSMFKSAMVYLPALWVMIGLAVLLTGLLPGKVSFAWIYLAYSFFMIYLGRLMSFPDWTVKLSPFGYIPQLPADEIHYPTLGILTAIAAVCTIAGFALYRRRDAQG